MEFLLILGELELVSWFSHHQGFKVLAFRVVKTLVSKLTIEEGGGVCFGRLRWAFGILKKAPIEVFLIHLVLYLGDDALRVRLPCHSN